MRLYWCVLFLLYSLIPKAFCDSPDEFIECAGGYCLPKYLCQNGIYQEFHLQDANGITLRLAEDDECFDNMGVCCRNETKIVLNSECAGGYCVQKELCPDGSYDETTLQDAGAISLKVGDGCQNDSQICCSAAGRFAVPEEVSDLSECGVSNTDGYRYESKGNHTHAQYAEFPWTVVIFESSRNSNVKGVAGAGSLLHPRFVLSAAHIFKQNVEWIARFGEWDLISEKHEVYPTQDINILPNIFIHPEYDKETLGNDIALAKLEREVVYKYHIRPICLPGPNDVFNGQRCISNGWGLDAKTNQYVNIMKRIELPVIPRKTCKQWFRATRLSPFFKLHKSVLCAGGETDADMCDGDGGGPLACRMEDGGYMLAGIVSWGLECNQQNVPGAYVDVAMFSEWIMSILNAA
uniref:Peptidase S1 domain-containing protein n=1 Tax=Anopheles atroparvus TaxID=41427 RepID=A0AAG5DQC7_ANOAO